jgi:hypothetical protein
LGNHDRAGDVTPKEIYEMDKKVPGSLRGDVENVRLEIYDRVGNIVFNVWGFDTGDARCLGVSGWCNVGTDSLDW